MVPLMVRSDVSSHLDIACTDRRGPCLRDRESVLHDGRRLFAQHCAPLGNDQSPAYHVTGSEGGQNRDLRQRNHACDHPSLYHDQSLLY